MLPRLTRILLAVSLCSVPSFGVGCGDPPPVLREQKPEILTVRNPNPILVGSEFRVTGARFDALGDAPMMDFIGAGVALSEWRSDSPGELYFSVTEDLIDAYALGPQVEEVRLLGLVNSEPLEIRFTTTDTIAIRLDEAPSGSVNRNEMAVIRGFGIISPEEGTLEAVFEGNFTPEGESAIPVNTAIPVLPAERFERERGLVRLSSALGGIKPGVFVGTMLLRSQPRGSESSRSEALDTTLRFGPPELFAIDPAVASLGQLVTIRGVGFLGGPEDPDESTLIRIEPGGEFTPAGGRPRPFGPAELILEYVSGTEVKGEVTAEERGDELVSSLFGAPRGVFRGEATVITEKGSEEVRSETIPFMLEIGPVRQVVWIRFLGPFYSSLTRFGLATGAGLIEPLVQERIQTIYRDWSVDVRLERPTDFSRAGYSVLDISGPDPNGIGLFGYDNTPGKDVNNLRLYDAIGGINALTLENSDPGYGGVFVESMLYFSSHPDLPGPDPRGRPDPDPLFDDIFDPVRERPATRAELEGTGEDSARNAQADRALRALASMVGETSAHEIGHSLGLANPTGSRTSFHNGTDGEGCLMDPGGRRSVGERTAQPGFPETRLCNRHPEYLDTILGL